MPHLVPVWGVRSLDCPVYFFTFSYSDENSESLKGKILPINIRHKDHSISLFFWSNEQDRLGRILWHRTHRLVRTHIYCRKHEPNYIIILTWLILILVDTNDVS